MKVVDAHVHFWNLDSHVYPWMKPQGHLVGDATPMLRNYEVTQLLAEAGDIEIDKVVHIEANHGAPPDPLEESRWLQALADSDAGRGMPNALVVGADLSQAGLEAQLAAQVQYRNVRGVRQILNVHADPAYDYVGRHFMHEPLWREQFKLLEKYGLSFDLQIYPSQMPTAVALARENPGIQLIVNHTGMFVDRASVAGYRAWRDGMRALAGCDNVAVKISGMAMLDHAWTVESLRPYVLETLDAFGSARCMFASNFPVDSLFSSYPVLWHAYAAIVADLAGHEREQLFRHNAERYYRI
jgi:predicted TIM-barrel fold metal-dependent hydrolase